MYKIVSIALFIVFLISNNLFSDKHYCIQIIATPLTEITSIWKNKKITSYIKEKNNCIMDKRKDGEYYAICCGDYTTYNESLSELAKVRKTFPKAFARYFYTEQAEKIEFPGSIKPKTPKKLSPKLPKKVIKKTPKPETTITTLAKPYENKNFFQDYISRNIINGELDASYITFSLKKFLTQYMESSNNFKIDKLLSEIYQINPDIENDKYNPNIYFNIGTNARKTYSVGSGTNYANFDAIASINLNWHLYDAQKKYFNNERRVIFKRLSELNLLASKDRTILRGISIYMDLWYLQQIIDKYNFLLSQQEKVANMIKVRDLRGGNVNIYTSIDSQNDIFSLKLAVSDIQESYVNQEHLFRQSLDIASPKPIYLYDPVYNELDISLKQLQKEAIANNKELARLQAQYNLSKSDLIIEAARKGWNLDLTSYGGYGYSTELEGTKNSGKGFEWQVGLRATYPLSERKDIGYQVEKKKRLTEQARIKIDDKIKTLMISVSKLYNSVKKLEYKANIYAIQNKMLKKRLNISYNRFLKGESSYKEYSDTLKLFTNNLRDKIRNEALLHTSILQLYIIIGKKLY